MLTKNFSLFEFLSTSVEHGLENNLTSVTFDDIFNLSCLVDYLQYLRESVVKGPLYINSGYRCPLVNEAVGGVPNSYHTKGLAADIRCEDTNSTFELFKSLRDEARDFPLPYKLRELIYYSDREVPFIHLSIE